MLEIKVPFRRFIKKKGNVKGEICPIYYWDQVQLQLECCDLDECDFWQCTLCEYDNFDKFLDDTCKTEPFRSKITSFEKGCLIQILPSDKILQHNDEHYLNIVHEYAKFIHPPKIEMTPEDCITWSNAEIKKINETNPGYTYDRTIYWYLKRAHCETIIRDKEWFNNNKHKFNELWSYITFVRSDQKYKQLFLNFHDSTMFRSESKLIYGTKTYKELNHLKHEIEEKKNIIIFLFLDKLQKKNNTYNLVSKYIDEFKTINDDNILLDKLDKLEQNLKS